MENFLKYVGIFFIVLIVLVISFYLLVSHHPTSVKKSIITLNHSTTSIKGTFNLSLSGSKTLFDNLTYNSALNTSYINTHALSFYRFYTSLPVSYNINKYYGGYKVEVNLTKDSKVLISKSYSNILVNLNGNYGYIVISGANDKITIANGLYSTIINSSVGAINDSISKIDAYSVG